jgi:Kef-type K+ transport system membrane component KefB
MPEGISFSGLVIVAAVAFAAPLVLGLFPRVRFPTVVVEIVAGIVIGPSVLGWVEPDTTLLVLSVVGLAFLLFVSGLEIDLERLRGPVLGRSLLGLGISLAIAGALGLALVAADQVRSPLLIAITLSATGLGLLVPVLKDSGNATTDFGQAVIAHSSVAEFGAVILLTLFFSEESSDAGTTFVLLALFFLALVAVAVAVARVGHWMRLSAALVRLQDTTAQIRIRGAVLLNLGFVALASRFGLETILGSFAAGAALGAFDRDAMMTHPHFRQKLEGLSFGFLVPVFFVTSGIVFDLDALLASGSSLALVPVFLIAMLVVRGAPAMLHRPRFGTRRAVAASFLQATSLPFIVTTTMIGTNIGVIAPATAAALVSAALLSVLIFPSVALSLLKRPPGAEPALEAVPVQADREVTA